MHAYLIVGKNKEARDQKLDELVKKSGVSEIITLSAEQKHTIQDIRNLKSQLAYSARNPQEGRVVIIDGAQNLTQEAANAFLKTLEEPLGKTAFFLLAPGAEQVTETIRSRCQTIELGAESFETEAQDLEKLSSFSLGEKLDIVDRIKGREEALNFCLGQLVLTRNKMKAEPSRALLNLVERLEQTRRDLEANVNVKIALSDLLLNYPQGV